MRGLTGEEVDVSWSGINSKRLRTKRTGRDCVGFPLSLGCSYPSNSTLSSRLTEIHPERPYFSSGLGNTDKEVILTVSPVQKQVSLVYSLYGIQYV